MAVVEWSSSEIDGGSMEAAVKTSRWRTRAENPLNIWVFVSVHPAILLSEFTVSNRINLQAHLVAMAFTLYGLIASLVVFLAIRYVLSKLGLLRRAHWAVLAIAGAITGASADISTLLFEGKSLANVLGGFPDEYFFGLSLGALLAIASALLETVRQEYSATRQMIIAEKVRQAAADVPARSQILASFIEGAKERLASSSSKTDVGHFATELRAFVNDDLRPLSHSLWEQEDKAQRKFSLQFLSLLVLSQPIRNPLPVAAFVALAAFRSVSARDPENWPLNILAIFAISFLAIVAVSRLVDSFPLPRPLNRATLILSGAAVGAALSAVAPLLPSWDPRTVMFSYFLLATIIILIAGTVTTSIYEIRRLLAGQAEELRNLLDAGSLTDEQARLLASIRARDAANYLHSTTQNRLLALAFRLEAKGEQVAKLTASDLAELDEILEDALVVRTQAANLENAMSELVSSWHGLLAIDIKRPAELQLTPAIEEIAFLAIREAVSNSYRHGKATNVRVELATTQAGLEITVADNGLGPKNGEPGLGAKIFEMASAWALQANPAGGAILKVQI